MRAAWVGLSAGLVALGGVGVFVIFSPGGEGPGVPSVAGKRGEDASEAEAPTLEVSPEPDPPAEKPSTALDLEPQGSRETAPWVPLQGFLVDSVGDPLEGAVLSWTPFLERFSDPEQRWLDLDYGAIAQETAEVRSDVEGFFLFDRAPPESIERPSVVWVTHPEWEAVAVLLDPGPEGWVWPRSLVPRATTGMEVTVVEPMGALVEGAKVEVHLLFAGFEDPLAPETLARRFFYRQYTTGPGGTARIDATPGRVLLRASEGKRLSDLWMGVQEQEATLTLLGSFVLSGRVRVDGSEYDRRKCRVAVAFYDGANWEGFEFLTGTVGPRVDGTFGPTTWPLPDKGRMLVQLTGPDLIRRERQLSAPDQGGEIYLELDTSVGASVRVLVRDPEEVAVEGARVSGYVFDRETEEWTLMGRAGSDETGEALVRGLPPGRVFFGVSKQGYASQGDGIAVLPRPEDEPVAVTLQPAGRFIGRVLLGDEPITRFRVHVWTNDVYLHGQNRLFEDEEGRFEFEDVPLGPVSFFVYSSELPRSDAYTVEVTTEGTDEVLVRMDPGHVASGRVVDALTNLPVPGAFVQCLTAYRGAMTRWREGKFTVDSDGRFEIPGVRPGITGYGVRAEGYTSVYAPCPEARGGVLDIGTITLQPLASILVVLRGLEDESYVDCRVWNEVNEDSAPRALGADGTVLLRDQRIGTCQLYLQLPDGTILNRDTILELGSRRTIEFDLSGGFDVTVQVVDGPSSALPEGSVLRAWYRSSAGRFETREMPIGPDRTALLRGLDEGALALEVSWDKRVLATGFHVVSSPPGQQVRIELGGSRRYLRLVDPGGQPIGDALVQVGRRDRPGGWWGIHQSDPDGRFTIGPLDSESVVLSVRTLDVRFAHGIPVHFGPDPDELIQVTVDIDTPLRVRLMELGRPCANVGVFFKHPQIAPVQYWRWFSDEGGLVEGTEGARGTYEIAVAAEAHYWPSTFHVPLRRGIEPPVLELRSRVNLALESAWSDGSPAGGIEIDLHCADLDEWVSAWIAGELVPAPAGGLRTDPEGRIELRGLPRGSYTWLARLPNGGLQEGRFQLAPGGERVVAVRLERPH